MKILDNIKRNIKDTFAPFFDPASKETVDHHFNEMLKQAEKNLPAHIKAMSKEDLAIKINKLRQPGKWNLTRRCAQGLQKSPYVGGNNYPKNTSQQNLQRRQRQIEKGIIQVTLDRVYKSSKPPVNTEDKS